MPFLLKCAAVSVPAVCALIFMGCAPPEPAADPGGVLTAADTPAKARTPDGRYISWKEHLIDDEQISGGVVLCGGDGLRMADLDKDGHLDIVSVHEDNHHIRLAFGTGDPDKWELAGNSGNFDGVLWLEQVRTGQPVKAFPPARAAESAHLPLPPE